MISVAPANITDSPVQASAPDLRSAPLPWCCPSCRSLLSPDASACRPCQRPWRWIGETIPDFVGGDTTEAERVLNWSPAQVQQLGERAVDVRTGRPVSGPALAELKSAGLCNAGGELTGLGGRLAYSLLEYQWQGTEGGAARVDQQLDSFMDQAGVGPGAVVLDVGCGAGQTLRLLGPRRPSALLGVDLDPESLAIGARLSREQLPGLLFARASGHALPLPDASVSHAICRVALNYMHQATALREMVRVLRPGGWLFLRVEGLWFDVSRVLEQRRLSQAACRTRDLGWGVVHAVTGWQPVPGTRLTGGRAFTARPRLAAKLARLRCTLERVEQSSRCPRFAGWPTQWSVLARRCS